MRCSLQLVAVLRLVCGNDLLPVASSKLAQHLQERKPKLLIVALHNSCRSLPQTPCLT